jgi:hypothetical protein
MGLMQGKADGLAAHIGKRAKGDLAAIRDGKVSDKRMAELKTTFTKPQLVGKPKRVKGGTQINLRSGEKIINLIVKKEGEAYKVTEMKFLKSTSRR